MRVILASLALVLAVEAGQAYVISGVITAGFEHITELLRVPAR